MYLIRIIAMVFFFGVAADYCMDVTTRLEDSGSINHMQVGVLLMAFYFLVSTLGDDARDNRLKEILQALKDNDKSAVQPGDPTDRPTADR